MNYPASSLQHRADENRAFSLVEVVLAMGVMSFALLGMVALLPMGLKTSHLAADAMTQAQIVQYSRNQLELTPFTNLANWSSVTAYFDNQGLPTTNNDPEQIYKVTYTVGNVTMSGTTVLTTNPNAPNAAADAQLVQVNIYNRTAPGATANVFPIIVPNSGF